EKASEAAKSAEAPAAAAKPSAASVTASAGRPEAPPTQAAPAARANGNGHGAGPSAAVTPGGVHILAAPSTRRFARERGVDLSAVPGSGPQGRVMREDVERVLREGVPSQAPTMRAPSVAVYPTG